MKASGRRCLGVARAPGRQSGAVALHRLVVAVEHAVHAAFAATVARVRLDRTDRRWIVGGKRRIHAAMVRLALTQWTPAADIPPTRARQGWRRAVPAPATPPRGAS